VIKTESGVFVELRLNDWVRNEFGWVGQVIQINDDGEFFMRSEHCSEDHIWLDKHCVLMNRPFEIGDPVEAVNPETDHFGEEFISIGAGRRPSPHQFDMSIEIVEKCKEFAEKVCPPDYQHATDIKRYAENTALAMAGYMQGKVDLTNELTRTAIGERDKVNRLLQSDLDKRTKQLNQAADKYGELLTGDHQQLIDFSNSVLGFWPDSAPMVMIFRN